MTPSTRQLEVITTGDTRTLMLGPSEQNVPLSQILRTAGVPLNTRCGERGYCQGCFIELVRGTLHPIANTNMPQHDSAWLRGCAVVVGDSGDVTIRIPLRSQLLQPGLIVGDFDSHFVGPLQPIWIDGAPTTTQEGNQAPQEFSEHGWLTSGQCSVAGAVGAIVDIGTTTVAVAIIDLGQGSVLSQVSAFNAQALYGDNVVTRIEACMADHTMPQRLQQTLIEQTLDPLLLEALQQANCQPEQLVTMVVAGNTVMLHLLVGEDPSCLGCAPFRPKFCDYISRTTNDTCMPLLKSSERFHSVGDKHGERRIHLLPSAGAFVGADVVAGVWASGMPALDDPALLVDLGTNGEIVLKKGDRYWGCATAAGPAFEGVGLSSGVRAVHGAISHVAYDKEKKSLRYDTIGNRGAIGICGTAYLDILALGREFDWINRAGRLNRASMPDGIASDSGNSILLTQDASGRRIIISEADIANLLQAKGAIAAGILCLLDLAGISPAEVTHTFIAGGFGFHLRIDSLLRCGLLPGIGAQTIKLVGNASLGGAYRSLLDYQVLDALRSLARRMEIIELNLHPRFEDLYIDQLLLP